MYRTAAVLLAGCATIFAQAPSGGWRRAGDAPPVPQAQVDQFPDQGAQADAYGQPLGQPVGQPGYGPPPAAPHRNEVAPPPLPPELMVQPGTYVTVRLNQGLSSDRNQPGDPFSATLVQPVVVDGVVVAQRGQMVYGRVAQAQRASSSHPSGLGLQLTGLTLVDGTQAPIHSQLVGRQGGQTPAGEQVGTVAATTAIGAAIGAAADWGRGAAIGAGTGAAAGLIGVMLTRNKPTVVYPETALTFRMDEGVIISTVRAPHAFRYVDPYEYDRPDMQSPQLQARPAPRPVYAAPVYGPPVYGGPAWGGYYPYRWGSGVSIVIGGGGPRYRGGYYPRYRRWR